MIGTVTAKNILPLFLFLILFNLCISQPKEGNITTNGILPNVIFNEEVPFKVGQEFLYKSIETKNGKRYANRLNTYKIERIEEIDNRTCYVVHLKWNATVYEPSEYYIEGEDLIYQEINTGRIIKVILNLDESQDSQTILYGKEAELQLLETSRLLFAPWMLNLSDDFVYEALYKVRVIGRELIDGEDSFKVKVVSGDRTVYMWISTQRSVLLKEELRVGNIIAIRTLQPL